MTVDLRTTILKYAEWTSFFSINKMAKQLHPLFEKEYPEEDTFRRVIYRKIKKLPQIEKHPFEHFYALKGNCLLDDVLRARWLKLANHILYRSKADDEFVRFLRNK
jgi:hypothetical protein